jgi:flagellar biosynthesis protein FlhF
MRLETFKGRDLSTVCAEARKAIGDDALIVHSRASREGGRTWIEVTAADPRDVSSFMRLLTPESLPTFPPLGSRRGGVRPFTLALVGPTGAGKTTTAAKLAIHPDAFGSQRVGFITLDTYRAGALEQLQSYSDAAEIPLEVVYDAREVDGALKRLASCEVIIVDTPGRGPRNDSTAWRTILRALRPDETHLVVPATMRADLLNRVRNEYGAATVTHALLTKLDEVPSDTAVAEIAARLSLPARWVTDGQEVPTDLSSAGPRVLGTLGIARASLALA